MRRQRNFIKASVVSSSRFSINQCFEVLERGLMLRVIPIDILSHLPSLLSNPPDGQQFSQFLKQKVPATKSDGPNPIKLGKHNAEV
jgi:hypothetical protein